MKCPVCEADLIPADAPDLLSCASCGYLGSSLTPAIGDAGAHSSIDEALRNPALASLRNLGFTRSLDRIAALCGDSSQHTLLDVGCAHGWFLSAAAERGFNVLGIEPDPVIAAQARGAGLPIVQGFFPDALPTGATFDVITFNDVFEHLPDVGVAARSSFQRLAPGGLLAIVLPNSRGILFRVARVLSRFGVTAPLDRLWQRGFPSPHLSYFHPDNLAALLSQHGFQEVHRSRLPSVVLSGLWHRLRYARASSLASSLIAYPLVAASIPALAILPPDISLQIFRRTGTSEEGGV